MILVDTSAWIEFLRASGSPVCDEVDRLLDDQLATTDAISMELLAGARDDAHLHELRRFLARASVLETGPTHFDHAAALYRACRRRGETLTSLIACLVAAVAIDAHVPILHADADYAVLSRHTGLEVHVPGGD